MFRKKRNFSFFIPILLLIGSRMHVYSQGFPTNLEWQKCYGWNDYNGDEGLKVIPTPDGNFTSIGKRSLNGLEMVWASKMNPTGSLIWETTISDNSAYTGFRAQDILPNQDGSFILVAKINNYSSLRFNNTNALNVVSAPNKGNVDVLVTKLDADGKMVWFKTFGGDGEDVPLKVLPSNDGGYIVLSYTGSGNGDISGSGKNNNGFNQDLWLLKLDSNGGLVSKKCIGGSGDEVAFDMKKGNDGHYIIVGTSTSNDADLGPNKGGKDVLVVKINDSLDVIWKKTFGGSQKDEPHRVLAQPNGDIIVGLISNSFDNDFQFDKSDIFPYNYEENIWLMKLNTNGDIQNKKVFGGSGRDILNELLATRDGNFAIGGSTKSNNGDIKDRNRIASNNNGAYDVFIMKVTSNFDFLWSKTLGGSADDEGNGLLETIDGAYVCIGTTQSNDGDVSGNHFSSQNNRDIWLLKINYSCENNITTNRDLIAVNTDIIASETITTSDRISNKSNIRYGASKSIDILPDFNSEYGDVVEFNLDGCKQANSLNINPIQIKVNNECREGGMKFKFMPFTPNSNLQEYSISVENLDPKIEFSFSGNTLITKNNLPNNGNAYFLVKVSKPGYGDFEYQSYTSTCEHDNAPIDCPENERDVILDKEYYNKGDVFTATWTGTLLPTQDLSWFNENIEVVSKSGNTLIGKILDFPAHIQAQPAPLPNGERPCHGSTRVEFRAKR
ncbi:hypothetical protein Emtol_0917 [Emticicia oligotrophica DSM 17448]|uniref:T9SS C-terminal target domain-containing protein n=2 Tax=Emticicia TaxID=312278 RepID=A0ABM5MY37_EMTOG|nr:hypothetical protein Emtol_0917 [Emticicia oligotrophica DSM 17448]